VRWDAGRQAILPRQGSPLRDTAAYAPARRDGRFQATLREVRAHVETQRRELERMRAEGLVPDRTGAQ
jgi:hypothetical protein